MVYTTSPSVIDCERILWSLGPNKNRTANLKDGGGCCRHINNFDSSNPEYYQHDITPVSQCSHLQRTERVRKKLVAARQTGSNLCLFTFICHPSRNGILVACRQQPQLTLWIEIGKLLTSLLSLIVPVAILKSVNQYNCIFGDTCYV